MAFEHAAWASRIHFHVKLGKGLERRDTDPPSYRSEAGEVNVAVERVITDQSARCCPLHGNPFPSAARRQYQSGAVTRQEESRRER